MAKTNKKEYKCVVSGLTPDGVFRFKTPSLEDASKMAVDISGTDMESVCVNSMHGYAMMLLEDAIIAEIDGWDKLQMFTAPMLDKCVSEMDDDFKALITADDKIDAMAYAIRYVHSKWTNFEYKYEDETVGDNDVSITIGKKALDPVLKVVEHIVKVLSADIDAKKADKDGKD